MGHEANRTTGFAAPPSWTPASRMGRLGARWEAAPMSSGLIHIHFARETHASRVRRPRS
jgi:hypothetical protein